MYCYPGKFTCHFNFFQNKNDCYLWVYCQKIFGKLNFGAQLCASSLWFTYQERQREMARRRLGNLKCIALKGANSIPIARAGEIRQLKF
jgi:hypothetical protein